MASTTRGLTLATMLLGVISALLTTTVGAAEKPTVPSARQGHSSVSPWLDRLARDIERARAIRDVKRLEYSYAQYSQFCLWSEMAALFTENAVVVDGPQTVQGRDAIQQYLAKSCGGRAGLQKGQVHTQLIDEPIINLLPDGQTAKGRWHELSMLGQYGAGAEWRGDIQENEYALEDGTWKIAKVHIYPQFAGPYETGWRTLTPDLKVAPYHYTPAEAGVPVPPAANDVLAERTESNLEIASRLKLAIGKIDALNDEDKIRNLQNAYGYYIDRKMWDDVTDLFAPDGVLEIGGVGVYTGAKGIRRALERDGPAGLQRGQLNNHVQFDVLVTISPDGQEARARGIDLGMLSEADKGQAYWAVSVFQNRYTKIGGVWHVREMRVFPQFKSDYYLGWGKSAIVDPPPRAQFSPDSKLPNGDRTQGGLPAFIEANPANGKPVTYPVGAAVIAAQNLLGPSKDEAVAGTRLPDDPKAALSEAERRLAVSRAYDGVVNVSSAFGQWIDDFQWEKLGALFADKGSREEPFSGFFVGPEHITRAEVTQWGWPQPTPRKNVPIHLRLQPVINVAPDGRSANLTTRLFSISASYDKAGAFSGAMYPNDQAVFEDGVWKLWSVAIDEFYYTSDSYESGWGRIKPIDPNAPKRPPNVLLSAYPPDIAISSLGLREEGFDGGTGEPIEWPMIKPLWFSYKNPVSGRVPDHYWPDCVTCKVSPQTSFQANGFKDPNSP